MHTSTENRGFLKYLSYKNEPRWLTVFIHIGFGFALLTALVAVVWTYLI